MTDNGLLAEIFEPDPEPRLRQRIAHILALAKDVPGEPAETVGAINAAKIIAETASEGLHAALIALLVSAPSAPARRAETLQAVLDIVQHLLALAPFVGAISAATYDQARREQVAWQTEVMRAGRQRRRTQYAPDDRATAFYAAVDDLRRAGVAVVDLKERAVLAIAVSHMPPGKTISRSTVRRRLILYKSAQAAQLRVVANQR